MQPNELNAYAIWLASVCHVIERDGKFKLVAHDVYRLREIGSAIDALAALPEQAEAGTTLTHAEVATSNQMFSELTAELADTKRQLAKLRGAIERAGFAIMQTSGDWSIHDVSELAEAESRKTVEVINRNVELESTLGNLVEAIEIDGSLIHGDQCFCDVCEAISSAKAALQENAG